MSERRDHWGEELRDNRLEWELDYDPGFILDCWRECAGMLDGLAETFVHTSPNNALVLAMGDVHWRAEQEVAYWEDQVRMRLEWRIKTERLTAFGEVLKPLMDRAGIATAKELLKRAGKLGEPHAEETLLRHMYGPPTEVRGGYLTGIDDALGFGESGEDRHQRARLSSALMWGTLKVTDGARVERDALGAANRALSEALDGLSRAQPRDEAERERQSHARQAIAAAGQIVAKEQDLQYRGRERSEEEAGPEKEARASA